MLGNQPQNHDLVATKQADGRYAIRELINGKLTDLTGYTGRYSRGEVLRHFAALRDTGDTWIQDIEGGLFELVQP